MDGIGKMCNARATTSLEFVGFRVSITSNSSVPARLRIKIRDRLKHNIRKLLWDRKNQKYFPHMYLAGSPFPWISTRMRLPTTAELPWPSRPVCDRVVHVGGFYAWCTPDNQPRGSSGFRGSAGELGRDIELLEARAERH